MKRKSKKLGWLCLLAASLLALTGCARVSAAAEAAEDVTAPYVARINELQAALTQQKEELYTMENEYQARITALENLLKRTEAASAETTETPGDTYRYEVSDSCAVITRYEGAATLLLVPATLDGYPVRGVADRAFEGVSAVSIVLPEGLTEIGWFAFYGCAALRDVTLPASVTAIGYGAFDGCAQVSVVCPADCYAAEYARSYGIPCLSP